MNIDIVCPQFLPSVGGIQIDVYNLAKRLAERGDRVAVLTSNLVGRAAGRLLANEVMDGITVIRYPVIPTPPFPLLVCTPTALPNLYRRTPDVLHVLSFLPTFLTNSAILIGKIRRIPLTVTPVYHPNRSKMYHNLTGRLVETLFDRWLGLKLIGLADCIVAQTRAELEHYRNRGLNSIVQVPIGVDLGEHQCSPEEAHQFAKKYRLSGRIVLCLGRIERRKGFATLLESLPRLLGEFPDATLLVAGDALENHKEYHRLARRIGIEDRIVSTGQLAFHEVPAALEMAEVVAVPSLFEVTSRLVLEAWAHKKPVVGSRNIGYAEIIDGGNGLLVDYGDAGALAQAISSLLRDPQAARRMGLAGFNQLKNGFLWDSVVTKTREVYSDAIERHQRRHHERVAHE